MAYGRPRLEGPRTARPSIDEAGRYVEQGGNWFSSTADEEHTRIHPLSREHRRRFQPCSRTIATYDELLGELVNLKR